MSVADFVEWKCKFLLFCNFCSIWQREKPQAIVPHRNWPQDKTTTTTHVLTPHYQFISIKYVNSFRVYGFRLFFMFRGADASLSYQKENI